MQPIMQMASLEFLLSLPVLVFDNQHHDKWFPTEINIIQQNYGVSWSTKVHFFRNNNNDAKMMLIIQQDDQNVACCILYMIIMTSKDQTWRWRKGLSLRKERNLKFQTWYVPEMTSFTRTAMTSQYPN